MAAQFRFGFRSRLCRFSVFESRVTNKFSLRSAGPFVSTRTVLVAMQISPSLGSFYGKARPFSSDSGSPKPNDPRNEKIVEFSLTQGPLTRLLNTANLWFVKKFLDTEFKEKEFLRGAKQALVVVTGSLDPRPTKDELLKTLPVSDLFVNREKMEELRACRLQGIENHQIISAEIQGVSGSFDPKDMGRSLDIDVCFVVSSPERQELPEVRVGNVKLIQLPHPNLTLTFRRVYFPDSASDWQIANVKADGFRGT